VIDKNASVIRIADRHTVIEAAGGVERGLGALAAAPDVQHRISACESILG